MGFMDKAKQAAQQAQKKLDEAQKSFNQSQSQQAQQGGASTGVRYDEQGRPIQQPTPAAGTAPPPSAQPPADVPTSPAPTPGQPAGAPASPDVPPPAPDQPAATGAGSPAQGEEATEPRKEEPLREDVNQSPDPFRPIQ